MTIKQKHSNNIKENIDPTSLKVIKNIHFTNREIDIIACLVGGRSYKKTASILSISPKTVEYHARNIMLRIGYNSREGIIDFVEKSGKFAPIRAHYENILVRTTFEQELKKLSPIAKKENACCLIFHDVLQITKTSFIYQLERHLNIAGVKTLNKIWVEAKSKDFLIKKIGTKQINCIIYALSDTFAEQLKELEYDIHKEAVDLIPLTKASPPSIIFLLLNNTTTLNINKNQPNLAYINYSKTKNYYFLFFELLQKILPPHSIDTNIPKFKHQNEMLQENPRSLNGHVATESDNAKNNNRKKKKNIFKWLTPLLICLIGFSFAILKINNRKNNLLIYQLQNKSQRSSAGFLDKPSKVNNIPNLTSYFQQREMSDVLHRKLDDLQKNKNIVTFFITGVPGTGKTELAKNYAYTHKNEYSFIRIFNAESIETLQRDFERLAEEIGLERFRLELKDVSDATARREHTIRFVLGGLKKVSRRWLWVFDNVVKYEEIKDYIPNISDIQGTIIITTTSKRVVDDEEIRMDLNNGMNESEAIELLYKISAKKTPKDSLGTIEEAKDLVKYLNYLPLAISTSSLYIKKENEKRKEISMILMTFDEYKQLLLQETKKIELEKDKAYYRKNNLELSNYPYTQAAAIRLSIQNLNEYEFKILALCSFMNPNSIPRWILEDYLKEICPNKKISKIELRNLVDEHPFLLIETRGKKSFDNDLFFIHRETHNQMRLILAEQRKKHVNFGVITFFRKIMIDFNKVNENEKTRKMAEMLLPHIVSSCKYAAKYHKFNKKNDELADIYSILFKYYIRMRQRKNVNDIPRRYRTTLMEAVHNGDLKNFKKAERLYIAALNEKLSEPNSREKYEDLYFIYILTGSHFWFNINNPQEAKKYYRLALSSAKKGKLNTTDQLRVDVYIKCINNDINGVISVYKQLIKICDIYHLSYLYYQDLAILYHEKGDFELAEQWFQKSLQILPKPTTHSSYGRLLYQQQKYSKAIKQFNFALNSSLPYTEVIFGVFIKHIVDGVLQEEIDRQYMIIPDSNSQKIMIYYYMVLCYQALEQAENANIFLEKLRTYVKNNKNDAFANRMLIYLDSKITGSGANIRQ